MKGARLLSFEVSLSEDGVWSDPRNSLSCLSIMQTSLSIIAESLIAVCCSPCFFLFFRLFVFGRE
jgi:hypothetical protein